MLNCVQHIKFQCQTTNDISNVTSYWNKVLVELGEVYTESKTKLEFSDWLSESYGINLEISNNNRFGKIIGVKIKDSNLTMLLLRYPQIKSVFRM